MSATTTRSGICCPGRLDGRATTPCGAAACCRRRTTDDRAIAALQRACGTRSPRRSRAALGTRRHHARAQALSRGRVRGRQGGPSGPAARHPVKTSRPVTVDLCASRRRGMTRMSMSNVLAAPRADARAAVNAVRDAVTAAIRGKHDVVELARRGHARGRTPAHRGHPRRRQEHARPRPGPGGRRRVPPDPVHQRSAARRLVGVNVLRPRARAGSSFAPDRCSRTSCSPTRSTAPRRAPRAPCSRPWASSQVSIDGTSHALPLPFMVIATQNPSEHHGTYPLPESQRDRFMLRVAMGYAAADIEAALLAGAHAESAPLDAVCSPDAIVAARRAVDAVFVHADLAGYAQRVVQATRVHEGVRLGVSTRGALAWMRAARAHAWLDGRTQVVIDDLQDLAVLPSRIASSPPRATTRAARSRPSACARSSRSPGGAALSETRWRARRPSLLRRALTARGRSLEITQRRLAVHRADARGRVRGDQLGLEPAARGVRRPDGAHRRQRHLQRGDGAARGRAADPGGRAARRRGGGAAGRARQRRSAGFDVFSVSVEDDDRIADAAACGPVFAVRIPAGATLELPATVTHAAPRSPPPAAGGGGDALPVRAVRQAPRARRPASRCWCTRGSTRSPPRTPASARRAAASRRSVARGSASSSRCASTGTATTCGGSTGPRSRAPVARSCASTRPTAIASSCSIWPRARPASPAFEAAVEDCASAAVAELSHAGCGGRAALRRRAGARARAPAS